MQDPLTAYQALLNRAETAPERTFLNQPFDGEVIRWTFREAADDACRFASALLGLGLQRGDKVALLAKNSAEWFLTDYAMMMAGLVSVPIYPTAGSETIVGAGGTTRAILESPSWFRTDASA